LDRVWSPWRYSYIASDPGELKQRPNACVFCGLLADTATDQEKYIVLRAEYNFVVLNLFPYTSGHCMVVPYEHIANLDQTPESTRVEMIALTVRCQTSLRKIYKADGFNIGMNQGSAAGAGVAGHLHMHLVPRWVGDANFMTTIGETRVLPESLETTYEKLRGVLTKDSNETLRQN
jgi:ATP adenylyltransferase